MQKRIKMIGLLIMITINKSFKFPNWKREDTVITKKCKDEKFQVTKNVKRSS